MLHNARFAPNPYQILLILSFYSRVRTISIGRTQLARGRCRLILRDDVPCIRGSYSPTIARTAVSTILGKGPDQHEQQAQEPHLAFALVLALGLPAATLTACGGSSSDTSSSSSSSAAAPSSSSSSSAPRRPALQAPRAPAPLRAPLAPPAPRATTRSTLLRSPKPTRAFRKPAKPSTGSPIAIAPRSVSSSSTPTTPLT